MLDKLFKSVMNEKEEGSVHLAPLVVSLPLYGNLRRYGTFPFCDVNRVLF